MKVTALAFVHSPERSGRRGRERRCKRAIHPVEWRASVTQAQGGGCRTVFYWSQRCSRPEAWSILPPGRKLNEWDRRAQRAGRPPPQWRRMQGQRSRRGFSAPGADKAGLHRSPLSPSPRFGLVLESRFWSCARLRPTSSDSLNRPSSSRRTNLLSVPVSMSSRGMMKLSLKRSSSLTLLNTTRVLSSSHVDPGGISEDAEHGGRKAQQDDLVAHVRLRLAEWPVRKPAPAPGECGALQLTPRASRRLAPRAHELGNSPATEGRSASVSRSAARSWMATTLGIWLSSPLHC